MQEAWHRILLEKTRPIREIWVMEPHSSKAVEQGSHFESNSKLQSSSEAEAVLQSVLQAATSYVSGGKKTPAG